MLIWLNFKIEFYLNFISVLLLVDWHKIMKKMICIIKQFSIHRNENSSLHLIALFIHGFMYSYIIDDGDDNYIKLIKLERYK